jgi:hypothetical protein
MKHGTKQARNINLHLAVSYDGLQLMQHALQEYYINHSFSSTGEIQTAYDLDCNIKNLLAIAARKPDIEDNFCMSPSGEYPAIDTPNYPARFHAVKEQFKSTEHKVSYPDFDYNPE